MAERLNSAEQLRPGKLYTRTGLLQAGMHPRVLASSAIVMPLPGMCARADSPVELISAARALQNRVRPGTVISHTTALELLGLPLPRRHRWQHGEPLHSRAASDQGRSRTRRIIVHGPRSAPRFRWKGVELYHLLIALQDCARLLSSDDLVVCIDALAGSKAELTIPLPEIRAFSQRLRGRGGEAVRQAAQSAVENVWSPMETRARLFLTRRGYPLPVANLRVDDPDTDWHGYIDLAYPQWRIAIEYDSEAHRLDRAQWQKDLHKNQVLHQQGWSVLRISVADLVAPEHFLQRLDAAISRAGAPISRAGAPISRAEAPISPADAA